MAVGQRRKRIPADLKAAFRQHAHEVLRKGAWFGGLPAGLQELILDHCVAQVAKTDQVLVKEDGLPVGIFAVIEGQIALTRQIGFDHDFFIHLAGPGFWFQERALLDREHATITATCRTPCRLVVLPVSRLDRIIKINPEFYRHVLELVIPRYGIFIRWLGQSRFLPMREFLGIRLADMVDVMRLAGSQGDRVELALSRSDIGNMIGATRQTAAQLLKEFEAEGLIELSFNRIAILDSEGLRGAHRKTGLHSPRRG